MILALNNLIDIAENEGSAPRGSKLALEKSVAAACVGRGFNYLSLITGAHSRLIVGYCLHPFLTAEGCG